jgi:predicted metal-dependent hydrolase
MATVSKTAKASTVSNVKTGTSQDRIDSAKSAEAPRLVSLNHGMSCRFFNPISQMSQHLQVGSEDFIEALRPSWEMGLGDRLRKEIEGFIREIPSAAASWRNALARLEAVGLT